MQTGQVWELGSAPNFVEHPQKSSCLGEHLRMHFEADYRFVFHSCGLLLCQSVACWKA